MSTISNLFKSTPQDDLSRRLDILEQKMDDLQDLMSHHAQIVSSLANAYNDIVKIFYDDEQEQEEKKYLGRIFLLSSEDDEFLN